MSGEAVAKVFTLLFLALFSWPFLGAADFPAKMKRHGVTLEAFKTNPPS